MSIQSYTTGCELVFIGLKSFLKITSSSSSFEISKRRSPPPMLFISTKEKLQTVFSSSVSAPNGFCIVRKCHWRGLLIIKPWIQIVSKGAYESYWVVSSLWNLMVTCYKSCSKRRNSMESAWKQAWMLFYSNTFLNLAGLKRMQTTSTTDEV